MRKESIKIGFTYVLEHFRNGILLQKIITQNLITDQGLNYVLDAALSAGTPITSWYVVLFESNTTPSAGLTYASPSYTECNAGVDEATRQAWTEAGVSAKSITNSASPAVYTFNTSKTIYGSAIVGGGSAATTKANTAGGGTLLSVSSITPISVVNDDTVTITATLTIASA